MKGDFDDRAGSEWTDNLERKFKNTKLKILLSYINVLSFFKNILY